MENKETAILLAHCKNKDGIIYDIIDFLFKNNGKVVRMDQHVDSDSDHFFIRAEWYIDGFAIPQEKIDEFFKTLIGARYEMQWQVNYSTDKPKVALFVSKYSHCFYDILSRYDAGIWSIDIPLIISNHSKFEAVANKFDIPYYHIPITKTNKKEQEVKELALLKELNIDLIILARYMQILSGDFIQHFPNKIINIHHSSLPAFPGSNPYKSAYQRGVKFMGATAHYVTEDLDAGPIITQNVIPISHRESIAEMKRKGTDVEKIVLADAVWAHINHKVLTYKNKTVVFT